MELTSVSGMLKAMHDNNKVEFTVSGVMKEDGSIKITGVNVIPKEADVEKVSGFKQ